MRRLRFLTGKELRSKAKRSSYLAVRLFHPRGHYPRTIVSSPNALFSADEELVYSVIRVRNTVAYDDSLPYSEMDWIEIPELQFLGALLLCEKIEEPRVSLYPVKHFIGRISTADLSLTDRSAPDNIKLLIQRSIIHPSEGTYYTSQINECGTHRYRLFAADRLSAELHLDYANNIDKTDYVLLRGLGALIKADMLSSHPEFIEEAIVSCFVAMEASFQLALRLLKGCGIENPTAHDAAVWLHETFDEPFGLPAPSVEKYFEEFYTQRIMTLHPSSRFGDVPFAPLAVDDYYHLRPSLRQIFAYLVRGEHPEDYFEAVTRHQQRG